MSTKKKRGTIPKQKITATFTVESLKRVDYYLNKQGVTRSYGLEYIVNHFLDNNPGHEIE